MAVGRGKIGEGAFSAMEPSGIFPNALETFGNRSRILDINGDRIRCVYKCVGNPDGSHPGMVD